VIYWKEAYLWRNFMLLSPLPNQMDLVASSLAKISYFLLVNNFNVFEFILLWFIMIREGLFRIDHTGFLGSTFLTLHCGSSSGHRWLGPISWWWSKVEGSKHWPQKSYVINSKNPFSNFNVATSSSMKRPTSLDASFDA